MAEAAVEPIGWEGALMAAEKVKERLRRATRALDRGLRVDRLGFLFSARHPAARRHVMGPARVAQSGVGVLSPLAPGRRSG